MKVALLAPTIAPNWGGVWQFSQWLIRELLGVATLYPVVSRAFAVETLELGLLAPNASITIFEDFVTSVQRSLAYRVLESEHQLRSAIYRRLARSILDQFFSGSVVRHALIQVLRRNKISLLHAPYQWLSDPVLGAHFPYLINPHDYQHEHFPELFDTKEIERRRTKWYTSQRGASSIVVHSIQTRMDSIRFLGIPEERVFYAPFGPLRTFPDVSEEACAEIKQRLRLPERFVFYPARTWPHKNHMTLIEAIILLRQRGLDVGCVFTDCFGAYGEKVAQRVNRENLSDRVMSVGRVSSIEMGALYRLCTMVVVPSLFEQNSGPMLEAIQFEKPVAVSNLPELVGSLSDSGIVFDGHSPQQIADAIDRIVSSPEAEEAAIGKIKARKRSMSWEPFREIYRKAYDYAESHPQLQRSRSVA